MMEVKKSGFSEKAITFLLPAVFSATVVLAFLYAYTESLANIWAVLTLLLTVLFFYIFDKIAAVKKGAALIFSGVLFAIFALFFTLVISSGNYGTGFMLWFFSGNVLEPTRPIYLAAFTPAFTFFVSSTVYYFSVRVYRKHWLLIIGLLPFTAYVKMVLTPPAVFVILIAAEELLIYLQNTRAGMTGKKSGEKSVFVVYADFALALILAAAIFPKPNVTPYYEEFEKALGRFSLNYNAADRNGRLSLRSGNADNLNRGETRLLYTAALPVFDYLKLQSYPYYDGDGDFWYISNEAADYGLAGSGGEVLSLDDLTSAINEAAENDDTLLSRYGLTAMQMAEQLDPIYPGIINAQGYSSVFAPAPSRTSVNIISTDGSTFYALFGGGILTDRFLPHNAVLNIGYAAPYNGENGYYSALQELSYEDYGKFLLDVMSAIPKDSPSYGTPQKFFRTHTEAMDWKEYATYQSPELEALALELTANEPTLSGKAQALEDYFNAGGFTYLLGYDAPNDSPEYFVFEGKIGSCSDFATAFTLLAGYAGLSVRYTEGYIPRRIDDVLYSDSDVLAAQYDNFDYYEITSDDAHAYPEVYINGLWRRFEPTVSALYPTNRGDADGSANADDDALAVAYAMAGAILGIIAIIAILTRKIFAEIFFRIKLLLALKTEGRSFALSFMFNRICEKLERLYIKTDSKTPNEVAKLMLSEFGLDIAGITIPLCRALYGKIHVSGDSYKNAYFCYKKCSSIKYRKALDIKART
ncbi:MAG: transglutaminase-like domain-containing protein [Ruminococcus sp.]|jgi:transglutaminase-like putative cysteine protease|nr:transglutaminase-like domain-containing protein [Ruminococcus sp.]